MSVYPDEKQARERVAEIKESHGIVPEVITFAGGFRLSFDPEDQPLPPDSIPPTGNYQAMITRAEDDDPLVQKPLRGI